MMNPTRRLVLGAFLSGPVVMSAASQPVGGSIKIGVLEDMSGVFADLSGPGSVVAARMAAQDYGGRALGRPVEIVFADHQNKPDVGLAIARRWFNEDGVGMILGLGNSAIALGVQHIAQQQNKVSIVVLAGSPDITGKSCSPTGLHWMYDIPALTRATVPTIVKGGGDSWFFVTADYAGGHAAEASMSRAVRAAGGKVLGAARHPLNTADFASFLLQARSSGAKVVSFANFGQDFVNSVKQSAEFGLVEAGLKLAPALVYFTDVHALGLKNAQGMLLAAPFYWNMNEETRKWSQRFLQERKVMPDYPHAGVYTAILHYLKAMDSARTEEAKAVVAKMRELPIRDMISDTAWVREDGRVIRDMYIYEVAKPGEARQDFDYFRPIATIPGDQAFHTLAESECPLVKRP